LGSFANLFNDLVGAREKRGRKAQAERFGGGEIDYEIELGRLFESTGRRLLAKTYAFTRAQRAMASAAIAEGACGFIRRILRQPPN